MFLKTFEWLGSGEVEDLFVRLQGKVVGSVGEDKMVLMNLYNNKFFVKFFYMLLWNQGGCGFISKVGCLEFVGPLHC